MAVEGGGHCREHLRVELPGPDESKYKRRVMRSLYSDEATDFITSSKSMASLVHRIHHFSR